MEQTLGKRIMAQRKRLNLTQDALAEKLGITAQAVSKWENDISCPDIAMLPKLSAIFGITTDELLGVETNAQVHEAEVVDEADDHGIFNVSIDAKEKGDKWVFQWDSGRKSSLFFALWVLLVGMLYLLAKWFAWDVSFWSILLPSFLLLFGIAGCIPKFSVFNMGMSLLGGYFLIKNLGIWSLHITGELIFPICIVLYGISLLFDALHKPKKSLFTIKRRGKNSEKTKSEYTIEDDHFFCDLAFGDNTYVVDLPVLAHGTANLSFGALTLDLSGCGAVAENCRIEANCSFGDLKLLVPQRFKVHTEHSTAFASFNLNGQPASTPEGIIYLDANASFGEIVVQYI